jgi:hypothetical protein
LVLESFWDTVSVSATEKKRLFRVSDKFIDKNAFLEIWKPRSNNKVGQKNEMKRKE